MTYVSDIYDAVCAVLLEPVLSNLPETTGLQLGMLTVDQFLGFFSSAFKDFTQESGLVKKLFCQAVTNGTGVYTEADAQMQVEDVFYNNRFLSPTDSYNLDALFLNWRTATGAPQTWNEDRVTVKAIQLVPAPIINGNTVGVSANYFGTLSAVTNPVNFTFSTTAPFYGTISSYSGGSYLDPISAEFGTVSNLVPSSANLMMSSTALPVQSKTYALTDLIQGIPDSFTVYLKYGVLERVFKMDGKMKDELRARYCAARFQEGVNLARAIMQEVEEEKM